MKGAKMKPFRRMLTVLGFAGAVGLSLMPFPLPAQQSASCLGCQWKGNRKTCEGYPDQYTGSATGDCSFTHQITEFRDTNGDTIVDQTVDCTVTTYFNCGPPEGQGCGQVGIGI